MLAGKSIIVTGAASGIGRAAAHLFASYGARLILADIDLDAVSALTSEIAASGGQAKFCITDVSREADVEALVAFALATYGALDGAFNNAGVGMHHKTLMDLTDAEWRAVIDVNLNGAFYCVKHQMRAMRDIGGGVIVINASAAGLRGNIQSGEYVASKHGAVGLMRAAAIEGGPIGIRVNAVCPGLVATPLSSDLLEGGPEFAPIVDDLRKRHVIGRFGVPQDVGEAAAWLLSDHASWITGVAFPVDGGLTA